MMLLALTLGLTCCARTRPSAADASVPSDILRQYFDLEQGQKYDQLYSLCSERRKKYLEKFGVYNAAQYRDLRQSSEASWSDFVIERRSVEADGRAVFAGNAQVEESGEAQRVAFSATLIKEHGTWTIDNWNY